MLLDTSVLIALERGQLSATAIGETEPGARLSISVITVSELLHGFHRARTASQRRVRERFLEALFAGFVILPFDLAAAREHARVWADMAQSGEAIGPHDLIIAATALAHQIPVGTLNYREFQRVRGLKVYPLRPTPSVRD